jgi:hypothetical protein
VLRDLSDRFDSVVFININCSSLFKLMDPDKDDFNLPLMSTCDYKALRHICLQTACKIIVLAEKITNRYDYCQ